MGPSLSQDTGAPFTGTAPKTSFFLRRSAHADPAEAIRARTRKRSETRLLKLKIGQQPRFPWSSLTLDDVMRINLLPRARFCEIINLGLWENISEELAVCGTFHLTSGRTGDLEIDGRPVDGRRLLSVLQMLGAKPNRIPPPYLHRFGFAFNVNGTREKTAYYHLILNNPSYR